ncbi:hypothetical protein BDD12DRAFT_802284 [Trichophaea hybrida]|nr:hypothetical protein BDD12DRAFT_802284 [Trichophaea hybrida]
MAAYIVAFDSNSYNSTGITLVNIECGSGILKSHPASKSRQWSDHAGEARRRRRVPVLNIAEKSFDEIYNDLSRDLQDILFESEDRGANIEKDTFYYITRRAGRCTPIFLACPLPVTTSPQIKNLSLIHISQTRSLSQSSRIEDLGDKDTLPNMAALTSRLCVRSIVPEDRIFTLDMRVEFINDCAAWE